MMPQCPATPTDAVLAVTYRCNARCQMCNIWQIREHQGELTPEEYRRLPNTLKTINLSGGEPFLRSDLPEVLEAVSRRNPQAHIVISTNGFQTERTLKMVARMRAIHARLGVGVSIDGIGPMHDQVRGIPGAFQRALATVRGLRDQVGLRDIRLAFTLQDLNADHLLRVHELARLLRVQFTWVIAHTSGTYFRNTANDTGRYTGRQTLEEAVGELMRRQLTSASPKDWARAYFSYGNLLHGQGRARPLACAAASHFFFMAPNGDIFSCNMREWKVGNLREQPFTELWGSEPARQVRARVAACRDNCWMVCTARTAVKREAARVAWWLARSKLRAHLTPTRAPAGTVENALAVTS